MKKYLIPFAVGSFAFLVSACLIFVESTNKSLADNSSFGFNNSSTYSGSATISGSTVQYGILRPDFYFTMNPDLEQFPYVNLQYPFNTDSLFVQSAYTNSDGFQVIRIPFSFAITTPFYLTGNIHFRFFMYEDLSFWTYDGTSVESSDGLWQDYSFRWSLSPVVTSFNGGSIYCRFTPENNSVGVADRGAWVDIDLNLDGIYNSSGTYLFTIPFEVSTSYTVSDYFARNDVVPSTYNDSNAIPWECSYHLNTSNYSSSVNLSRISFVADSNYYSFLQAISDSDLVNGSDLNTIYNNLSYISSVLADWNGDSQNVNAFVFSDFSSAVLNYLNVISQFDIPDYTSEFSSIISYLVGISSSISSPWSYYDYNAGNYEILPSSPVSTNELLLLLLCCFYGADPYDMSGFISSYFNDSLDRDFAYEGFLQYIGSYFDSLIPLISYLSDQFVIDSSGYSPFISQLETVLIQTGESFAFDQINATIIDFRTKFYDLFKTGIVRGSFYNELETILYQVLSDFMNQYEGSGSYSDEMDDIEELESQYWEDIESNWGVITDPDFSLQSWSDISSDEPFSGEINLFMSTFTKLFNRLGSFKFVIGVVLVAGFTVVFLGKINQFGKLF